MIANANELAKLTPLMDLETALQRIGNFMVGTETNEAEVRRAYSAIFIHVAQMQIKLDRVNTLIGGALAICEPTSSRLQ